MLHTDDEVMVTSAEGRMTVYALRDPHVANAIQATRYVGVTDDVDARLRRHLIAARNGSPTPLHVWLRELGTEPVVEVLGMPHRTWAASAERVSIGIWRAAGAPLLNVSEGGSGALTDAQRARLGAALRDRWREPQQRVRWLRAARQNQRKAAAQWRRACQARRTAT